MYLYMRRYCSIIYLFFFFMCYFLYILFLFLPSVSTYIFKNSSPCTLLILHTLILILITLFYTLFIYTMYLISTLCITNKLFKLKCINKFILLFTTRTDVIVTFFTPICNCFFWNVLFT